MTEKKNILCVVGTRPECIKMAPVIQALRDTPWANVTVASTGQHRELVHQTLEIFGVHTDIDLDVMVPNQTLAGLSSRVFATFDNILEATHYDLILAQGDTTTVMIVALAAFYRKVPVGHVEAGLRTHNLRLPFPEELNRVVTGLVSSLHFAPTERARQNLLNERVPDDTIHVTGNTVIDALLQVAERDFRSEFPQNPENQLVLITAHRRENFGKRLESICRAIRLLQERYSHLEFVYPVHPNPNVHDPVHAALGQLDRIHLIPPADYMTLVSLMKNSLFILTDSGGIQEEAPALAKPVLVMRDETERPEAVEAGGAMLVGVESASILNAVQRLMDDRDFYSSMSIGRSPYGDGKAAERIAEICQRHLCEEQTPNLQRRQCLVT